MNQAEELREDIEDVIKAVCKSADYSCQVAAEAILQIIEESGLINGRKKQKTKRPRNRLRGAA